MLQVDEHFEVAASRDRVFRMWTAFERFPAFLTGIELVHLETEARMRWRVSIAGVEPVIYAMLTELVPDERIAWVSVDQSTMGCWIDLEDAGAGRTGVTVRLIWAPRGDALARPGDSEIDERTIRCDLQHFRALVEGAVEQAA